MTIAEAIGENSKLIQKPISPKLPKQQGLVTPNIGHKPKVQNYEYNFKRNGNVTQKPTSEDYSFATIKMNPLIKEGKGFDDYSPFTTREKRSLTYKLEDNTLTGFELTGDANKEKRQQERALKGKKRKGNAFTINDEKVADELYSAVAGNSNVEYIKYGYKEDKNSPEKNYIKTDGDPKQVKPTELGKLLNEGKEVVDVTHSHPFRAPDSGTFGTKFASSPDMTNYKNTYGLVQTMHDPKYNVKMPDYKIYHPWSPDQKVMPYTMSYNQNGLIFPDGAKQKTKRTMYNDMIERTFGYKILNNQ